MRTSLSVNIHELCGQEKSLEHDSVWLDLEISGYWAYYSSQEVFIQTRKPINRGLWAMESFAVMCCFSFQMDCGRSFHKCNLYL